MGELVCVQQLAVVFMMRRLSYTLLLTVISSTAGERGGHDSERT